MERYQIITDAASDLTDVPMAGLPHVEIIPMTVDIGGRSFIYGPGGDISVREFYDMQRAGRSAKTAAINPQTYTDAFEPYLRNGQDVLYIGLSSSLSGTFRSAEMSARALRPKYPGRKIFCIDSLCASLGEGFLVREAAGKQAEGLTADELAGWLEEQRRHVCHWFTVDTFEHLLKGGRVSAAAAVAGTVLNIKPLLHVDGDGALAVMGKPRGRRKAIAMQMEKMEQGWTPETGKFVLIGHGDNPEGAEALRSEVSSRFPEAEIYVMDIGPVIGAHTGPGMLAVLYWGSNR